MGSFCAKYARLEPQKDRGVAFYDTEQWCKMWISPYLTFSKMAWGIGLTFIRALKSLKNYTLMRYFCLKCMFQLENFIGILCRETEQWCKFIGKLTRDLQNDIRNLVNFHSSNWKYKCLLLNVFLLCKAYKGLDEKVQKSSVSWHWRVIQSLKKKWLLVPKVTWSIWWILMGAVASLKIWTLMYYFCL